MALNRAAIPSPNYSSRGGTAVRLVVLHTAEGSRTIESLGSFFANPASGVSSHTGIDDKANTVGEYVPPGFKAWTQANANPYSVATELCGFASWTAATWYEHPNMLANCAAWIAEECGRFGIPLKRLTAGEAQGGRAGVCQHVDLGAAGGNHWDCGSGFPMEHVMEMAAGGRPNVGPPQLEEGNMVLFDERSGGYWVAFRDGAVHTYKGAPYLGSPNTPGGGDPGDYPCIGIGARRNGDGYTLALELPNRDVRLYEYPYDGSART